MANLVFAVGFIPTIHGLACFCQTRECDRDKRQEDSGLHLAVDHLLTVGPILMMCFIFLFWHVSSPPP